MRRRAWSSATSASLHISYATHSFSASLITRPPTDSKKKMFQDIGCDNILCNWRGGPKSPRYDNPSEKPTVPFRSHFPIRYYLNDFEIGLSFDETSDPSSRTTTGFPHTVSGRKGSYGRAPAPEMLKPDVPHCPFRVDVWQAGRMMKESSEYEVCDISVFSIPGIDIDLSPCGSRT